MVVLSAENLMEVVEPPKSIQLLIVGDKLAALYCVSFEAWQELIKLSIHTELEILK